MLKIYGADLSTPANKVRMTANFLNIPYEYIQIKIREGEHRTEKFLSVNPVGKIPAIDDDGFTLFESGAICRYLAGKAGNEEFYPGDLKARAVVDAWTDFSAMHIQMAMNRVVFNTVFYKFAKIEIDERSLADGKKFLNRFLPAVDKRLSESENLAGGNVTLADVTLINALDPAEVSGVRLEDYGHIVKWRNKTKENAWYTGCHAEYGLPIKKMMEAAGK